MIWSGGMTKINKRKRSQVRNFCLTDLRFINFGDNKLRAKVASLFSGSKVKRSIDIAKITHLTYSESSNQFVVHVPSEYDYNLRTLDRDEFIVYLLTIRDKMNCPPVKIWLRPEINLEKYSKTDTMKNTVFPSSTPKSFSANQF